VYKATLSEFADDGTVPAFVMRKYNAKPKFPKQYSIQTWEIPVIPCCDLTRVGGEETAD
jgi:hypothetical protein